MRRALILLGGGALVALVAWAGAGSVGHQVLRAGWAIPACVALHAVQLWLSALAWRGATGVDQPPRLRWLQVRWVREAVNSLLPVAQLGGNVVGVRLLSAAGVPVARATAGVTRDITMEAVSQAAFTIFGVLLLLWVAPDRRWLPWVATGATGLVAGVAGFVALQRYGVGRVLALGLRWGGRWVPALARVDPAPLAAAFAELSADRAGLLRAGLLHGLAWLLGTFETVFALVAMGLWPGWVAVLVVESLGMAARSVGFAVPGALGVQEAGTVLVCGLFGIPADAAVALSMVKRARELVVGVPGLLVWQARELRGTARFLAR